MAEWKPGDPEPKLRDGDREFPFKPGAVEAWAERGVFPPPAAGDPENPRHVANVKRARARYARLKAEGKARQLPSEEEIETVLETNPDLTFGEMLELLFRDTGLAVSFSEDGEEGTFPPD